MARLRRKCLDGEMVSTPKHDPYYYVPCYRRGSHQALVGCCNTDVRCAQSHHTRVRPKCYLDAIYSMDIYPWFSSSFRAVKTDGETGQGQPIKSPAPLWLLLWYTVRVMDSLVPSGFGAARRNRDPTGQKRWTLGVSTNQSGHSPACPRNKHGPCAAISLLSTCAPVHRRVLATPWSQFPLRLVVLGQCEKRDCSSPFRSEQTHFFEQAIFRSSRHFHLAFSTLFFFPTSQNPKAPFVVFSSPRLSPSQAVPFSNFLDWYPTLLHFYSVSPLRRPTSFYFLPTRKSTSAPPLPSRYHY